MCWERIVAKVRVRRISYDWAHVIFIASWESFAANVEDSLELAPMVLKDEGPATKRPQRRTP
jgi:hypothetical protein